MCLGWYQMRLLAVQPSQCLDLLPKPLSSFGTAFVQCIIKGSQQVSMFCSQGRSTQTNEASE